jgi:hypothetical protein
MCKPEQVNSKRLKQHPLVATHVIGVLLTYWVMDGDGLSWTCLENMPFPRMVLHRAARYIWDSLHPKGRTGQELLSLRAMSRIRTM